VNSIGAYQMSLILEIKRIHSIQPKPKRHPLKPRRERREEQRDQLKASKLNQKKIDRLSV
jgi:hypothetical protein